MNDMKKKILVVEDDATFRAILTEMLAHQYNVNSAENGKVAKEILSISQYDLVVSDIQMPYFTGVDLLEWIKRNKPCPVILMTGFAQILETQRADQLGADDFISKPFSSKDFIEKIEKILGSEAEQKAAIIAENPLDVNKQFCKVSIEDFISKTHTECSVYIKLSNSKYVKVTHKGGKIPEDKILLFKEKGIDHLYIRQEDFRVLVGFSVLVAKAIASSGQVDKEKKSRFMKHTGELISQQAFASELDPASFSNAKDFITTAVDVLTEDDETFSLLDYLKTHTDHLYAHSIGTSMLSVMIAKELGWQSPQTLFKLAFAGLFHEIGMKEIPREILEKPRVKLSTEERQLIETHPTRGKEILESLKMAPSEAILVAYEHHENALGQGYPRRINHKQMHPLTKIVQVADMFCDYTIVAHPDNKIYTAQEALRTMETFKLQEIDSTSFQALCKVVRKQNPKAA